MKGNVPAQRTIGQPISIEDLAGISHVCAFTLNTAEHDKGVASLITNARRTRQKTMLMVDRGTRASRSPGIEQRAGSGPLSGSLQVEVLDWAETYLEFGRFDPRAMLATIERLLDRGSAEGYDRVRIIGDLGWAAGGADGAEHLLAYESELDTLLSGRAAEVLCVYNLADFSRAVISGLASGGPRFDANLLVDVLNVHPTLIVNGEVFSNAVYRGTTSTLTGRSNPRTPEL